MTMRASVMVLVVVVGVVVGNGVYYFLITLVCNDDSLIEGGPRHLISDAERIKNSHCPYIWNYLAS